MSTVYIQSENVDHIRLNNDTGADLAQYEFTVIGGLCLVADEIVVNGEIGSFHLETNLIMHIADFVAGELTFGTVNAPVYWDPSSGDFSDTEQSTYYKIGTVEIAKDSSSVVVVIKDRETALVSAASDAAAVLDDAVIALAGRPFFKVVTFTAAAAGTLVDILTDAEVDGGVVFITDFLLNVNGGTAWSDSTGTIVTIQDKAGSPVVGITAAKAQLTANAMLDLLATGITLADPISDGLGFTATNGIDIVADSDFDAGSDIIVTVAGFIIG